MQPEASTGNHHDPSRASSSTSTTVSAAASAFFTKASVSSSLKLFLSCSRRAEARITSGVSQVARSW